MASKKIPFMAPQGFDFLLQQRPVGDPGKQLSGNEAAVVDSILSNPTININTLLLQYEIDLSPQEFGEQAKIQLYTRQRIAQIEAQQHLIVSKVVQELVAMAFVDVMDLETTPVDQWTPEQRRAVVSYTQKHLKTSGDEEGEKIETKVRTAKMEAIKEFIKMFKLDHTHPAVRALASAGKQQEITTTQSIQIGDISVEF